MPASPKRANARSHAPPKFFAIACAAVTLSVSACRTADTTLSPGVAASSTTTNGLRSSTTPSAPATTTGPSDEQAILRDYERFWTAVVAANNPPDPESSSLAEVATGPMLETARRSATQNKKDGSGLRFAAPSRFSIEKEKLTVAGSEATLVVCLTDDIQQYRIADNSVIDGEVSIHRVYVELQREGQLWKVRRNDQPKINGQYEPCGA